jgi:hypothetical protein
MDGCSLFALIACFNWSGFYVDGGLSYQDSDLPRLEWVTHVNRLPGAIETVTQLETVDDAYNPYGRISLGYEINFKSVTLSTEAFYRGSFEDNGAPAIKGIELKARWYPFRQ